MCRVDRDLGVAWGRGTSAEGVGEQARRDGCGELRAVNGGVNRWWRPMGFGRSWRRDEKCPVVREEGGAGDGCEKRGRTKAGVGLAMPGGRGGQGVGQVRWVWAAQLQNLWGLCPAGAGLWPSCH